MVKLSEICQRGHKAKSQWAQRAPKKTSSWEYKEHLQGCRQVTFDCSVLSGEEGDLDLNPKSKILVPGPKNKDPLKETGGKIIR